MVFKEETPGIKKAYRGGLFFVTHRPAQGDLNDPACAKLTIMPKWLTQYDAGIAQR